MTTREMAPLTLAFLAEVRGIEDWARREDLYRGLRLDPTDPADLMTLQWLARQRDTVRAIHRLTGQERA